MVTATVVLSLRAIVLMTGGLGAAEGRVTSCEKGPANALTGSWSLRRVLCMRNNALITCACAVFCLAEYDVVEPRIQSFHQDDHNIAA
jgi:hypothetical protein